MSVATKMCLMYPLQTTLENLLLGFFRLLVAIAALLQGGFAVLLVKSGFSFSGMSPLDACLKLLYFMHLLLRLGVAIITLLDTVYGPQTLLGPWPALKVEEEDKTRNEVELKPINRDNREKRSQPKKKLFRLQCKASATSRKSPKKTTSENDKAIIEELQEDVDREVANSQTPMSGPCRQRSQTLMALLSPRVKWLTRAGLYLTLATSAPESTVVQRALPTPLTMTELSAVGNVLALSGYLLYTAGLVALLAAGLGLVFPRWLRTPWARQEAPDASSGPRVTCPDGETNDPRLSARAVRWNEKHCKTLSRLLCMLTTIAIGNVHLLRLTSTAVSTCVTTSITKCWPESNNSQLQIRTTLDNECVMSILQPVASCVLPSLSAMTLCACVSFWILADLITDRMGRRVSKASTLSAALMYLCCLSTTWSRKLVAGSGNFMPDTDPGEITVTEGYNQQTSLLSSSSTVDRVLFFLDTGLVKLISSATTIFLPFFVFLLSHSPVSTLCTRRAQKERQSLKSKQRSATCKENEYHSVAIFFQFVQAIVTLVSFCGLGLVLISFTLPWITVTIKTSSGFHSVVNSLKNMSTQLEVNKAATDALLQFSVCSGDHIRVLSSQLGASRQTLNGISVEDIANYCQSYVCQDKPYIISSQREESRNHQPTLCDKFCSTLEFFQDNLEFNPLLHSPMAPSVKGDKKKQDVLLKNVILTEKQRFVDSLQSPGAITNQSQQFENDPICLQTLCILRGISAAGLAFPLTSWVFKGIFMTVEALIGLFKLIIRAKEMAVVFSDFKVLVDSLTLRLEHSQKERTVFFSITNYSLVYMAYPVLITGCIGILVGFWHRQNVPDYRRRRRFMFPIVLPLLVLNVFGAVVTLLWAQIVESLVGYVTMLSVTVSLELGGRLLLVAFTCSACSCLMFFISASWHSRLLQKWKCSPDALLRQECHASGRSSEDAITSHEDRSPCAVVIPHGGKKTDLKRSRNKATESGRHLPSGCRPWLLAVLLACGGTCFMLACTSLPVFHVRIDLHKDVEVMLARVEQDGLAVEVAGNIQRPEETRCDIAEAIGRAILLEYLNTLNVDIGGLRNALKELESSIKNEVDTVLPFVTLPCLVILATACVLVVYGAAATKLLAPKSRWLLPMSAAASGTRRLAMLSLTWLLYASLTLAGPVVNAAAPDIVHLQVHLAFGFALTVAAHIMVLLGALELRLAQAAPLL